jgi:hypothetical protein
MDLKFFLSSFNFDKKSRRLSENLAKFTILSNKAGKERNQNDEKKPMSSFLPFQRTPRVSQNSLENTQNQTLFLARESTKLSSLRVKKNTTNLDREGTNIWEAKFSNLKQNIDNKNQKNLDRGGPTPPLLSQVEKRLKFLSEGRLNSSKPSFSEVPKPQVISITYEEIGLFPRSFNRVFDRFFKQLFFDVENLVIQEYRFYRYLFLTTVKCLFILIFLPLIVNFFAKNYLVRPITEYYWNKEQPEIFLNSYQQKRAFTELHEFEEKIYFESLLTTNISEHSSSVTLGLSRLNPLAFDLPSSLPSPEFLTLEPKSTASSLGPSAFASCFPLRRQPRAPGPLAIAEGESSKTKGEGKGSRLRQSLKKENRNQISFNYSKQNAENVQKRLQIKTFELARHYNFESIEAITNFFADFLSFGTLIYLLVRLEIQINITKSFLLEVFFGLDDSKKSLLILFITDLLVGYHSPNIWELLFQSFFDHYGLPESQTTIFLLVATLPVLLDVLFKYLIFRHLNRASPATVATYHAMIE